MNNDNKFKQQKKNIRQKLCGITAIIYKAAAARGIKLFNIKPFNTIWPQLTWQLTTKVRLTISYNLRYSVDLKNWVQTWLEDMTLTEYKPVVWLGGDAVAIADFFIYARRSYEVRSTTTLWRPQIRDKRATSDVHDISNSQVR